MEVEKAKKEELPDFGDGEDSEVEFQKVVETDKDVASDAIISLKPRKDLISVAPMPPMLIWLLLLLSPRPSARRGLSTRFRGAKPGLELSQETIKDGGDRGCSPPGPRTATQKGPR